MKQDLITEINMKLLAMGRQLDTDKLDKLTCDDLALLKQEMENPVMRFNSYEEMKAYKKQVTSILERIN